MAQLLTSKELIEKEKKKCIAEVSKMEKPPTLLIVRVGDDKASERYVRNKIRLCSEIGILSMVKHYDEKISEEELLNEIYIINKDNKIDGCLIQLPLPKHINENIILDALLPEKDVDGFSKENLGKLIKGQDAITSCTPQGIIDLLKFYNIEISRKNVVIINRSTIVGKPLALLFLNEDATVTICHSKTENLKHYIDNADILVTAVGKKDFLGVNDFKESKCKVIIDVSINLNEENKLCGDINKKDYDRLLEKGISLTPVPLGVGGMTVLSLIKNIIKIKKRFKVM